MSSSKATLLPSHEFNSAVDAEVLYKAMKGFGTDENAIINVVANRTNNQRIKIAEQFKILYHLDLIKELKGELSGNFENLVIVLMTPIHRFYATELRAAISGNGTDEATIIEVLCTLKNEDIHLIKAAYSQLYKTSLEKDLGSDTSGGFKRLLVPLCSAKRDESTTVDKEASEKDARALLNASKLDFSTEESTFTEILCSRSYIQLQQVFKDYKELSKEKSPPEEKLSKEKSLKTTIKKDFSGDIEDGLLAIVESVSNRPKYFAKCLHASMKGLGTTDSTLIRIVATRCEVDMADIKKEFQEKYGKTLESFIKGDTSGDYKKCLIALIS